MSSYTPKSMRCIFAVFAPLAALVLAQVGCITVPPVHQRALENNEICAQYINQGDLTRAEVHCDLGLQFSPQYADLHVNKGLIYLRREQIDRAKESFIKALRYNQEQAQAYNNLGYVYFKENAYGKAHDNFQRALKVNPDYTEARYNLALTLQSMGEKEKAKKEYRTIIGINPNLADPYRQLGQIFLEEGNTQDAIEQLSVATQRDPTYGDAWLDLCSALVEAARYSEAKDACSSCIEADPNNVQCRNNLPIIVRKTALQDPALQEIKETQSEENTPASFYMLARSLNERGLRSEEERAYKKCLKLDGKYAQCHFGLFEIYKEDRRDDKAGIACKNFLKFAVADEFPKEVETCERFVSASSF